MRWSQRLEQIKTHERPSCSLTPLTHSESVSDVGEQERHIRKKSARVVPLVRCRDCRHFQPDHVNPAHGIGRCRIGAAGDPADRDYRQLYPANPRRCDAFEITPEALLEICREACNGLDVDAEALREWLTDQADPEWMHPAAVRRWAQLIEKRGFPHD
jgi:hypothetical protein